MEFNNQNEERKVITAEEFKALLVNNKYPKGYQLIDNLILENSIVQNETNQLTFNDCHFNILELHNIGDQTRLIFNNCTVNRLFIDHFLKDKHRDSMLFRLFIQDHSEIKGIFISNHPSIEINFSDSIIGDLDANDCSFTEFNCEEVIFKNKLVIEDSKLDLVRFDSCNFEKYFTYYGSTITDKLTLINCHFKEQFIFAMKEKSTDLSNLKVKIESCKTDDNIVFHGKYSSIKQLSLFKHNGGFAISDLNIITTEIQGSHERNAFYRFSNSCFHNFQAVAISSAFQLSTIKSLGDGSVFSILISDLNNTSLFDVDFQSFNSVIIEKSDFTNMTTSRVTWFEDKKLKTSRNSEFEDPYERREFYRQLKYNQEKQGNKIQALTFQSLEMQYYSLELDPKKLIDSIILKNKFLAFFGHFILAFTSQNRFILWIGKSNNHGQSFLKPLAFLVVLGLIFNFLIIQSASPQSTVELLFKKGSLKMLPSLLNPVHDISKLLHVEETSFWTSMLDLIWKVVETTLIFQTITAFRKHVRV